MRPYQKINHFPGMYNIARKNFLCKHLNAMIKLFPKEYDFSPVTFNLPYDYNELKNQFNGNHPKTFIVKPEANS
jgi:tubulin polyglutamylase TTLL6/13